MSTSGRPNRTGWAWLAERAWNENANEQSIQGIEGSNSYTVGEFGLGKAMLSQNTGRQPKHVHLQDALATGFTWSTHSSEQSFLQRSDTGRIHNLVSHVPTKITTTVFAIQLNLIPNDPPTFVLSPMRLDRYLQCFGLIRLDSILRLRLRPENSARNETNKSGCKHPACECVWHLFDHLTL